MNCRIPGTRVLQFAFDGHRDNPYLPHNFVANTVVYTGTHDNPPTREWYEELEEGQRQALWNYLRREPGQAADAAPALMQLAWSSKAALAIAPLQDLAQLRTRWPHEYSWMRRRKLAMALHRSKAVASTV